MSANEIKTAEPSLIGKQFTDPQGREWVAVIHGENMVLLQPVSGSGVAYVSRGELAGWGRQGLALAGLVKRGDAWVKEAV